MNGDSRTDIIDLQNLVNLILGITSGTPGLGDLNHDGSVNILDLQALVNVILGISSCPA